MARFNASEAENYGGQGGAGFFRLANDGDVARVRFMYDNIDDVEGMSVHQVEIDGKKRWVNCLRDYRDPMDKCPFCRDHQPVQAKLFVPIYDVDEDRTKIWERGKKFFNKISGLCGRYPHLVEKEFEIERHGKAGDQQTTYEIFPMDDSEPLTMDDLPELPANTLVLDKSAEDMEYYLEEGVFPPEDDVDEAPRRRSDRSSRRQDDADEVPFEDDSHEGRRSSRQTSRRTPASSGGRRGRSAEDAY